MTNRNLRATLPLVVAPVVAATLGWGAATLITDPSDVAAAPPTPSLVTTQVERTRLESAVVARGEVVESSRFEASLVGDVHADSPGQPVYTGRLAKVGNTVKEGAVLAEVSGRPVFVIEGSIPMHRTLGPGSHGPDVKQLEHALRRLGHHPGKPDDRYDDETEAAVAALYQALGYAPAETDTGSDDISLDMAEDVVDDARAALAEAEAALAEADVEASPGEILAAKAEVLAAQREVAQVEGSGDNVAIAQANAALALAREGLAVLLEGPDVSRYKAAIAATREDLAEAEARRDSIAAHSGTAIPRGELIVVPSLPRVVRSVDATVGQVPGSKAFTLTGTTAEIVVQVPREEGVLIRQGQEAGIIEKSWGIDMLGKVAKVGTRANEAGLLSIRVTPAKDLFEAVGANVRVRFPVAATDDEVLAVSVAAVYTAADGRTYVDHVTDTTPGREVTKKVEVTLGLASDSMVQITPRGGTLTPGDRVAVSRP
ncbi:peptidoglycan-binding domain-containing protein [Intrasporangium sp.]|uniref:peptidoglycan-binding domain-containing protein n=1 Tax=Intrasporangium sp. TaxID=1925024 RepID=UPI00293AC7AC|nr:peptidoglycan-binding domain-containing protein [Intrasporangium sp.]MDV3222997.1 peptidoglycan-binding protein [Intrasporangium sp.]